MAVGVDGKGPWWAAARAGQGDKDLAAKNMEVPSVVPFDAHTLVVREGGGSGPMIT